ncbi:MAG: flagellar filament capping protein FliD [Oscillospiraceae bacterium]|nr:flagellar filament capping protein FliD [Oscillospiraceae bacterium]
MSTINPATVNRAIGMSTGIDTDALVRAMSQNQQNKVDTLFRQKTLQEWRSEAVTNINDLMTSFKNDFTSLLGANSMMKAEAYRTMGIKNPNENSVSMRSSVGAKVGSYSMSVEQLATAARFEGSKLDDAPSNITTRSLSNLFGESGVIQQGVETDANGGYTIEINGKEFSFKATDRISDVMNKINNDKDANVTLTYSQISKSFTLSSKATGENSEISIDESSSGLLEALGINIDNQLSGQNAKFTLNGVALEETSNTFTYDGIEFTLHAETDSFRFNTERDSSKSLDSIKKFVETLNGIIKTLNEHYTTKKNTKFYVLTDDQKDGFSEKELERWESKSKEGLLHRDNKIGNVLSSLQRILSESTEFGSLRDIGISGGQYKPGQPVTFEIDEEKLLAALEADPDRVYNMFTKTAASSSDGKGGIIAKVDAAFDTYMSFTKSHTLQTTRDSINRFDKDIKEQTTKLWAQQEKLYLKYASLEKSMAGLNSQMNSVLSYFG